MKSKRRIGLFMLVVLLLAGVASAQEGGAPQTGTDPRDFANKFMPYYRYTELDNGLVQKETVLFGLFALSPTMALTYEVPLAYERDVSDTALFVPGTGPGTGCVPGGGAGLPPGGIPLPGGLPAAVIDGLEGDCKETGIGDMNMRLLLRGGHKLGVDWIYGIQVNFPTASEDVLGSETFSLAPMVAQIADLKFWPGPGAFAAFMHFYQFDVTKDAARPDQSLYIGRYFFMLPLIKKYKIYALPEFQPIYDFESSEFSFWAAPEFGKMLGGGNVLYLKPGWGIDPEDGSSERKLSFEAGWRKFM